MRACVLLLVTGCGFQIGGGGVAGDARADAAGPSDASDDAVTDATTDAMPPDPDAPPGGCVSRWFGAVTFSSVTRIAELDTTANERDPTISADELAIYFSSNRGGGLGSTDVWVAKRASRTAPFGTAAPLAEVNSADAETRFSFAGDGLVAVLGSNRAGGAGGTDVWTSSRATINAPWGTPTQTGLAAINNGDSQHDPFLSPDGLRLYFAPSTGGQHLEVATRANRSAAWGAPTMVTTPGNSDADPTLSSDERVLVFASRRQGSADVDLWYATRASSGDPFGTPLQLPAPINSAEADGEPALSADGCRLYFGSTRPGGAGQWDLYVAEVAP